MVLLQVVQIRRWVGEVLLRCCEAFGWRPNPADENEAYWGLCPYCGRNDGYLNLGRGHWYYCHRHRVRWCVGENLFSTWRQETPTDWKDNFARIGHFTVLEQDELYEAQIKNRKMS